MSFLPLCMYTVLYPKRKVFKRVLRQNNDGDILFFY